MPSHMAKLLSKKLQNEEIKEKARLYICTERKGLLCGADNLSRGGRTKSKFPLKPMVFLLVVNLPNPSTTFIIVAMGKTIDRTIFNNYT